MRAYKATYKDKATGESRQTAGFYVQFRDHADQIRRLPALKTKSCSEEFGRKIERLVSFRIAGTPVDGELVRWIETLPPKTRQRLAVFGLLDREFVAAGKSLFQHVEDFKASLEAKDNTKAYVELVVGRIRAIVHGCGFQFWSDISASRVQEYLTERRKASKRQKGISSQTHNFYLVAFKQFCTWMQRDRRANASPVDHLQGLNARLDRRHDRRPLSAEELMWLLDPADKGPTRAKTSGSDRALLYRVAAETGLRANELRTLTVSSFSLDTQRPTVTVAAGYSKHRKQDVQLLKADTASLLKHRFANLLPGVAALPVPPGQHLAKVIEADLAEARSAWLKSASNDDARAEMEASDFLKYQDSAGRFADFHALRHATASFLAAAGVSPKVAQSILRHSDINLTMSRYSHSYREDEKLAVEKLPDLSQPPPTAANKVAKVG